MSGLSTRDQVLCAIYGVLGVVGLIGTQVVLVRYVTAGRGNILEDVVANGAATFVTIDLLVVALVALVFMIVEARRLSMRFLWVYVVLTFAVAISVSLPAFLIARQVHLARRRDETYRPALS